MVRPSPDDIASYHRFAAWCAAEYRANQLGSQVQHDLADPRYQQAEAAARQCLFDFLCKPTSSLYGILLKLKVACHYEDYVALALDPQCHLISPRAIVAAMADLENILLSCGAVDPSPSGLETVGPRAQQDAAADAAVVA